MVLKATFNSSVDSTTLDVGDLSEMEKDVDEQDMVEDVEDDQGVGEQAVMEDLHLEGPLVISGGDEREGNWRVTGSRIWTKHKTYLLFPSFK